VNICLPRRIKVSVAGCVMQVLILCMLGCSSSYVTRMEVTCEAYLMRVVVHILWSAQELCCVLILVVPGLGCNIVGCVLILWSAQELGCLAGC